MVWVKNISKIDGGTRQAPLQPKIKKMHKKTTNDCQLFKSAQRAE